MIYKANLINKPVKLIAGCFIGFLLFLSGCKAPAASPSPDDIQNTPTPALTVTVTPSEAPAPTVTTTPSETPTPTPFEPDYSDAMLSTWIWDSNMVKYDDTITQLVKYHIDDAYVYFTRRLATRFDEFIGKAADNGIKVEALLGYAEMALSSNQDSFTDQIKTVLDYNKNYSNRFYAIHLDIEPYVLPDWSSHITEYLTSYLDNLKKARLLIDQHNRENDDSIKLILDIPFWYYQDQFDIDGVNILDSLFEVADELVIMNYTKDQYSFISNGNNNLNVADKYPGKTLKVGMEFQSQITDVTLYTKTPDSYQRYIDGSVKEFEKHESFGGYAIHYFNVYIDYLNK